LTPSQNKQYQQDLAWVSVWEALQQNILDPFDVHAVVNDLMSAQINKLSPTEVTYLQRRVRQVVNSFPKGTSQNSTHKMMNRFRGSTSMNGSDSVLESRSVVEKYHQLDETAIKKIFCAGDALKGELDVIDPLASLFTIGAYLSSDYVLDRSAFIASDSAEKAGLVLDVNKNPQSAEPPEPVSLKDYLPQEPLEVVGVDFQSLAYLVALALRKFSLPINDVPG
jgi:hypothetical protein